MTGKHSSVQRRQTLKAYGFMTPALIIIILFTIIPIIGSLVLMFYDYSVLGQTKFVGLKNFVKAFHDRVFWISIKNSVIFVVVVPIIQILSILLAVLVNKKLPGIGIFRTLFYIPVVTSMVAVSIMWGFIFDTSGIINTALKEWKVISMPLGFLSDKNTAMICLMFITIWQGLGYYMMMYLAGLQGIPQELCEAATIDGANAVKVFTRIKLPMLKPYIWFCSLNSVISAIGVFDVVFVLTKGGPNDATMVINYYSYTKAFSDFQFGYAAAIGAVQAVVTTMLSIVVFVYGKRGGMTNNKLVMKRKAKKAVDYFFTYLLLIVIAIICAGPFIWLLLSSLRTGANIYNLHFSISDFSFSNYTGVMEYMNLPKYIWNTVIITFGGIIIDVVFSSLCAYPLATMEFKGKNIIFTILVGTMIIPAAAGMIINYLIITKMHLLNTMLGVILPSSTKAFSIILLRQAYLGIPKELIEAAKLDGAGELKIWKNVMIPGILPSVSTIVIFDFIANWNAFLWPIIVLQDPEKYPLATALQYLNGSFSYKFGYVASGTIISIIPVLIVFMMFQKNYIEAVSGAVKG